MGTVTFLIFGLAVLGASAFCVDAQNNKQNYDWWSTSTMYQVYPRSFKDSNGDGMGDLNGITSKLEHLKDAGIDIMWLSPVYASPQSDFGYDISNFIDIAPIFGTLADFDKLLAKAKSLGLRVMLDFVPNHTSNEHEWFQKSVNRIKPYDDYYIWQNAKKGPKGERLPPNNWLSRFVGSAWEWNEKRQQYYYHSMQIGEPDLNLRNPNVLKELQNVLIFWLNRGVDGFRVDAVPYFFEDPKFRDEPRSNKDVPPNDSEYLDHIYTREYIDEICTVIKSWQSLLDDYVKEHKTDIKIQIIEAYSPIPNLMRFYNLGSSAFNFMFVRNITRTSTAADYKTAIDRWLNSVPPGNPSNWVVGNHDNSRVASRFGVNSNRADQITLLGGVLPGMLVMYNGDEIAMIDRHFTYEETVDPLGCRAGPERYYIESRDPERIPFQWDATTSAGFSTNPKTWLPVHSNYKTLNLAAQKAANKSHYKIFQDLLKLRKTPTLQSGGVEVKLVTEKVLAVVRRLEKYPTVVLLINFEDVPVTINAKTSLNIDKKLTIRIASLSSGLDAGSIVDTTNLTLPGTATIILSS